MNPLVRRSESRTYPTMPATLRRGSLLDEGVVRNLSANGAMFDGAHGLAIGEEVVLEIRSIGAVASTVVWSIGPRAGLSFRHSIAYGR